MKIPRIAPDDVSASAMSAEEREIAAAIARLDAIAKVYDANWRIPLTNIRFGTDPLISLVPGLGDAVGGLMASYIVMEARRHGAPRSLIARMLVNVGVDVVLGSVPIAGTIFDVFFKVSQRNVKLLRDHLEEKGRLPPLEPPETER